MLFVGLSAGSIFLFRRIHMEKFLDFYANMPKIYSQNLHRNLSNHIDKLSKKLYNIYIR